MPRKTSLAQTRLAQQDCQVAALKLRHAEPPGGARFSRGVMAARRLSQCVLATS